jgi:guanylate kinase
MSTVFIISAPSGSGKSTLVKRLLDAVPDLTFSISYTTRAPRGSESNGQNYRFVSRDEFKAMIERGEFLEYAEVFGNYYGTHQSVVDDAKKAGKDVVLDIDVQGARQLKQRIPQAVTIFVLAPSRQILEARLRARGEDGEEVVKRRLRDAAGEIKNWDQYDYVLINENLDKSVADLCSIIQAERVRRTRIEHRIRPILDTFED